ncbi:hypothetical protein M409DRAFT_51947 [Zasmidium cellare ATCC 36951]|uniref:Carboxylic ester hydrolase n=1 Tax=Zasmidium cellare ATCC 36951 TaxID=1080233 RepID=A0A6A6CVH3_ZASCE|nr:uncharacterized protein M409DRAFT_51947 [Zasmidium cellare ATCC 36951]KAF2170200.1 hypothetical protein M409DRAFT_51947 [Zasmidium cellare ATCC 36951]
MPREQLKQTSYTIDAGPLGWLEGLTLTTETGSTKLHYFGGIPYALPPARFRQASRLPERFRYGTKAAPGIYTKRAAVCPQPGWLGPADDTNWDENCLQVNIYIPAGTPPREGWPVFFYIHGGFLQWGNPNMEPSAVAPLLSETAFQAIMVSPAYRVNALGFLASKELQAEARTHGEPIGNQGLWDQRLALEWTAQNIGFFGGNPNNITVGGYSAGSHSTFQQLAHELYAVPKDKAIIKRAIMWSNSPGVQAKDLSETQKQFDELLHALDISASLSAAEKLERLRAVPIHDLIAVQDKLKISEFRALSDGDFVSKNITAHINSGDFAKRMKARGIKLMNGECRDEHQLYQAWRTPANSCQDVYTRLCGDYPEIAVKRLLDVSCGDQRKLPAGSKDWQDAFGRLYANMQVHCLERGFHRALVQGGLEPGKDLLRYRFNWRTKSCDSKLPPDWGVTHATDMSIWFWGLEDGLTDDEKKILATWNENFADFVKGNKVNWGTTKVTDMLRLRDDGETDIWTDDRWEEGLKVWDAVNGQAGAGLLGWVRSKL